MTTGHERLILDLRWLLAKAEAFQFHDFKNTDYATPKVELDQELMELSRNVRRGKYDNISAED